MLYQPLPATTLGQGAAGLEGLWKRWQAGQSLSEIGVALGKHAGSIHGVISLKGGIAPTARKRSSRHLTLQELEQIKVQGVRWVPERRFGGRHPGGVWFWRI